MPFRFPSILPFLLIVVPSPAYACIGDCNGDANVQLDEVVLCMQIGLGSRPADDCATLDADENQEVSIVELVGAVNSLLSGCPTTPTPTATPTITATPTPTLSPTPAASHTSIPVYRTYPDFPIAVPLLEDPVGSVVCTSDALPHEATISDEGIFEWLPADDELGPFHVAYECTDEAVPPNVSAGDLFLKVQPRDPCVIPTCDPASGCVATLPPLDEPCCTGEPIERVAEPQADCPAGRVVFAGGNVNEGFGRLQNCDKLRMFVMEQSGASIRLGFQTRCMNPNNRVRLRARLETSSPTRPLAFDFEARLFPTPGPDGFQKYLQLNTPIDGDGPFFDLEDAEADLIVTATDSDDNVATERVRVILTSTPQPDLPDLEATPGFE